MNFDPLEFVTSPQGITAALLLIFLAGLSEGFGTRGVVLLVNRTTPLGLAVSLLIAAILYLISALLWVGGIWITVDLLFDVHPPPSQFLVVLSAAYAPLLLGALALLPLVGMLIRWLLRLWSLLIALGGIVSLGLEGWQAVLAALVGTLLFSLISGLLSEKSVDRSRHLIAVISGQPRPLLRKDPPLVIPGYSPPEETQR